MSNQFAFVAIITTSVVICGFSALVSGNCENGSLERSWGQGSAVMFSTNFANNASTNVYTFSGIHIILLIRDGSIRDSTGFFEKYKRQQC